MFKKFRDRLNEGVEEVKRDPRFQSSLASVSQLTAGLNKSESAEALAAEAAGSSNGQSTFSSSDLPMMTNNDHLFSMGDEDETGGGGNAASTHLTNPGFESVDLTLPAGAQGKCKVLLLTLLGLRRAL